MVGIDGIGERFWAATSIGLGKDGVLRRKFDSCRRHRFQRLALPDKEGSVDQRLGGKLFDEVCLQCRISEVRDLEKFALVEGDFPKKFHTRRTKGSKKDF